MVKKRIVFALALTLGMVCLAGGLSACTGQQAKGDDSPETGKIKVVATLFPQYDFTRHIAGDKAEVTLLLPPGVESHAYEPTPADIIKINTSQLFIYTGENMEVWAHRIIEGLDNQAVAVVDVSQGIKLGAPTPHEDEGDLDHEDEQGHTDAYDPHIWTDPNNAVVMVDHIAEALCQQDPENAQYYQENAAAYKEKLVLLDKDMRQVVESGVRREVIFAGRNPFYYLLTQYGLGYQSAFDSCSTETEPSVKIVARLTDIIQQENIPVIFYEELSEPKVAQSIANETGAKMLLLHSCHNVSKQEWDRGETYLSLMGQNLANLREALN